MINIEPIAGGVSDQHAGAATITVTEDASDDCNRDAVVTAVVRHQRRVLLLHQLVHYHGPQRDVGQVRHHRDRDRDGPDDASLHTSDGQEWAENSASLRTWRNVHLFYLYNHLISGEG